VCNSEVKYEEIEQHLDQCKVKITDCPTCQSKVDGNKILKAKMANDDVKKSRSLFMKLYQELKLENQDLLLKLQQSDASKIQPLSNNLNGKVFEQKQPIIEKELYKFESLAVKQNFQQINEGKPKEKDLGLFEFLINLSEPKEKANPDKNGINIITCSHGKGSFYHIFECCSEPFPCKRCHNDKEKHKRAKMSHVKCNKCNTVSPKTYRVCPSCKENFFHKAFNNEKSENSFIKRNHSDNKKMPRQIRPKNPQH
jgi:hypothetical protein